MYCDNCGNKLDDGSKFCDSCGAEVISHEIVNKFTFINEDGTEMILPNNDQHHSKKKIFILCVVAIIVVGIIILSVFLHYKPYRNDLGTVKIVDDGVLESIEWDSEEFLLDGHKYALNSSYTNFYDNGFKIDLDKYGYTSGYSLNQNDKTSTSVKLENKKYNGSVKIGLINLNEGSCEITKCDVWGIEVDNLLSDKPVLFELPGGIKNNSSLEDIIAAYGDVEDIKKDRFEDLAYTVYHYQKEYELYLDLVVYDEYGLVKFSYKKY